MGGLAHQSPFSNRSLVPSMHFCLRSWLSNSPKMKSIFCCICPAGLLVSIGCVTETISTPSLRSCPLNQIELSFRENRSKLYTNIFEILYLLVLMYLIIR